MAGTSYTLTYAGVPFFGDDARAFRANPEGFEGRQSPRKHQSAPTLAADVEKMAPAWQRRNFPQSEYPGRNLGNLAITWGAGEEPYNRLEPGEWFYPLGATRWSVFVGLATSRQARDMLAAGGATTAQTFVIKSAPDGGDTAGRTYQISTPMRLLPPRQIGETRGTDGLYLITLVDDRFFWRHKPFTLHVTEATTWASVLTSLATALGITLTYSTLESHWGNPEPDSQLWTNSESAAVLLDVVAHNVGRAVVRNFDGTYALQTPSEALAVALANRRPQSTVTRIAGGDAFQSGGAMPAGDLRAAKNAVVPSVVRVTCPKYVTTYPGHFYDSRQGTRWYVDSYSDTHFEDVGIASGGAHLSGVVGHSGVYTFSDTAKSLYTTDALASVSGGTPDNVSGLRALAMGLARNYWEDRTLTGLDETLPGTLSWTPEGLHDVIWTYSPLKGRADCRVLRREWTAKAQDMQHRVGSVSGTVPPPSDIPAVQTVLALAGSGTTTAGGTFFSGRIEYQTLSGFIQGGLVWLQGRYNYGYPYSGQRYLGQYAGSGITADSSLYLVDRPCCPPSGVAASVTYYSGTPITVDGALSLITINNMLSGPTPSQINVYNQLSGTSGPGILTWSVDSGGTIRNTGNGTTDLSTLMTVVGQNFGLTTVAGGSINASNMVVQASGPDYTTWSFLVAGNRQPIRGVQLPNTPTNFPVLKILKNTGTGDAFLLDRDPVGANTGFAQLRTPNGAPVSLPAGASVPIIYDPENSWYSVLAQSPPTLNGVTLRSGDNSPGYLVDKITSLSGSLSITVVSSGSYSGALLNLETVGGTGAPDTSGPKWTKYTKTFSDWAVVAYSGTTQATLTLFDLGSGQVLHGVIVKVESGFNANPFNLRVGYSGQVAGLISLNVNGASGSMTPGGDTFSVQDVNILPRPLHYGSTMPITLTANITGPDTFSGLVGGRVDVRVQVSCSPP